MKKFSKQSIGVMERKKKEMRRKGAEGAVGGERISVHEKKRGSGNGNALKKVAEDPKGGMRCKKVGG